MVTITLYILSLYNTSVSKPFTSESTIPVSWQWPGGYHLLLHFITYIVFIKFYMYLQQIICCIYIKMNAFDLQHHFSGPAQGRLMDGKVIDTSLSREPLVVELGKRSVITGMRLRHCSRTLNDVMFITTELL